MKKTSICVAALLSVLLATTAARAAGELPPPLPNTFVHDFAGVIAEEKRAEIQAKAQQLKDQYRTEIAVVTVASLEGEESFDYSMRMARSWGIGSPDTDVRGLLILVAVGDRKTAFRTSRHIEAELPDGVTGDIGRQMNAHFKNGDFGGGLSLGLSKILERLSGVYEPRENRQGGSAGRLVWLIVGLGFGAGVSILLLVFGWSRRWDRERQKRRGAAGAENRRAYFAMEKPHSRQTGQKTRERKEQLRRQRQQRKEEEKRWRQNRQAATHSAAHSPSAGDSDHSPSSSSYGSSSSSSDTGSSYDYGSSSSSSDSGSSYSGGSDFGGGGSDSSW